MSAEEIAAGLTDGERRRLIMGRTDWREDQWQDHCGDPNCEHCTGFVDDHVNPNWLSEDDKAVRALIAACLKAKEQADG